MGWPHKGTKISLHFLSVKYLLAAKLTCCICTYFFSIGMDIFSMQMRILFIKCYVIRYLKKSYVQLDSLYIYYHNKFNVFESSRIITFQKIDRQFHYHDIKRWRQKCEGESAKMQRQRSGSNVVPSPSQHCTFCTYPRHLSPFAPSTSHFHNLASSPRGGKCEGRSDPIRTPLTIYCWRDPWFIS